LFLSDIQKNLGPVLRNPDIKKAGHNLNPTSGIAPAWTTGFTMLFDTMIAACDRSFITSVGTKDQAKIAQYSDDPYPGVDWHRQESTQYGDVSSEKAAAYAAPTRKSLSSA
jgi:hypothetical protein